MFGKGGAVTAAKSDRRTQRTKEALWQALMSLITERGFEELTVRDILERANVGRATFYAHFDNKEDMLASRLETLRLSLKASQRGEILAFSGALFEHAHDHRDMFRAMIGKRSGAVVQRLFHKMLADLVRDEMRSASRGRTSRATADAAASFIASGLFGLLTWWVDHPQVSAGEMNRTFHQLAIPAVRAAVEGA
jgi:AcrR family transcriptional regulator